MAINGNIVQYYTINSGFLPDILLFTKAPIIIILVWFDGTIIDIISTILLQCTTLQWLCWVMIGGCTW